MFFKVALKKIIFDVHLVEMSPPWHYYRQLHANYCHLRHWRECLIVVDTVLLRIALAHQLDLVLIDIAVNVVL